MAAEAEGDNDGGEGDTGGEDEGGSGGGDGDGSFMTPDIHTLYLYQYSVYLYYILPISHPR